MRTLRAIGPAYLFDVLARRIFISILWSKQPCVLHAPSVPRLLYFVKCIIPTNSLARGSRSGNRDCLQERARRRPASESIAIPRRRNAGRVAVLPEHASGLP